MSRKNKHYAEQRRNYTSSRDLSRLRKQNPVPVRRAPPLPWVGSIFNDEFYDIYASPEDIERGNPVYIQDGEWAFPPEQAANFAEGD